MSDYKQVYEVAKKLADTLSVAKKQSIVAKIVAVDRETNQCIVESDGVRYEDVMLLPKTDSRDGLLLIPVVGSVIVCSRVAGSDNLYVSMWSECESVRYKRRSTVITVIDGKVEIESDEVVINGGELGGLVKIEDLKANLESLKQYIEKIHSAIPSALTAVGAAMQANGATAAANYSSSMSGAVIAVRDMENKKIKQ